MSTKRVLIVDDDANVRRSLSDILRVKGYEPMAAATGEEGLDWLGKEAPAVALIDLRLGDVSGLKMLSMIKERAPATECIVLTGHASQASAIEAVNLGAYSYVQKPYDVEHLLLTVQRAVEKREAAEALRRSEVKFRSLIDQAADMLYFHDMDGNILDVNQAAVGKSGYTKAELLDTRAFDIDPDYVAREGGGQFWQEIDLNQPLVFEAWHRRKDGSVFPVEVTLSKIELQDGVYVLALARDITERKRAEEALKESVDTARASEEKYRLVSENIPVLVYSALPDKHSTNTFMSGRASELTGYSRGQFLEDPELWTAILHPEDRAQVWEKVQEHRRNKAPLDVEYRIMTRDKQVKWIRDRATPTLDEDDRIIRIDGFIEDITERKRAEHALAERTDALQESNRRLEGALEELQATQEQLVQQERLAAVGQLAGGIAHDFNNLLTSIILDADMLLRKPDLPADVAPSLESIVGESRKAAQLVQQILDFSRRSLMHTRPVDLSPVVEEAVGILRRTLPETIRLRIEMGGGEYVVNADPARIQQALLNLGVNARDAMPEGGDLLIGLSTLEVGVGQEPPVAEMAPGEWVCLAVSDTGTGMPSEVVTHLFEPFFTTKPVGEGTGLGLAQVYGIVKQHDGAIDVDTVLEGDGGRSGGTTFRIYLPACRSEEQEAPRGEEPLPAPEGQGECILLVEDEEAVREAGRSVIESLGYRVISAENGRQALEICRSAKDVDLVITDIVMPEMGGKELMRELMKEAPDLRALAITGYMMREDLEQLRAQGFVSVIRKPFDVETLAQVIRCALDREGGS